jgi:hypothetical protein
LIRLFKSAFWALHDFKPLKKNSAFLALSGYYFLPIFLRKIGLFLFQVQCLGTRHRFVSLFMFVFVLGLFSFASFPYNNNQHDDNYADFRYQKQALPNEFLHGVLLSVLGIISETTGKTLAPI